MINLDNARELRIKRANTDWWIHEQAMVGANGKTYIAYYTDMGEIHVKELDAKCSREPSRDVCLCRLNCNYSDEHNSPSICIMESGHIIVAYTGHAENYALTYRVTQRPYDIFSFGPEQKLEYSSSVTYAQLSENVSRGELWLFCRVNSVTWEFRYSKDEGTSWSEPTTFLVSDAGGLFYFDVHRQLVSTPKGVREQWFFALYGHPRISKDHTIRSGIFDCAGNLLTMEGEKTGINLYEGDQIKLEDLAIVYDSPEGTTVRLLAVSPTLPYRVGLTPFVLNQPETIVYHSATYRDGVWQLSAPIAMGGEFLSPATQIDGSQTYVGGMAYYYGVGEAGLTFQVDTATTNRIFIARFDGVDRVLESYQSLDKGRTYQLEHTIKKIAGEKDVKIWRPVVPMYAQDNLPVYWHEGTYCAHTGGWHCDEVMLVEYDD
ncbi:MAG: BNR-4 repeat-containing protein [Firmicutes bacterium]|nr:BNR-4 repeat-containing protein [Bacillota bacterium]